MGSCVWDYTSLVHWVVRYSWTTSGCSARTGARERAAQRRWGRLEAPPEAPEPPHKKKRDQEKGGRGPEEARRRAGGDREESRRSHPEPEAPNAVRAVQRGAPEPPF